MCFVLCIGCVFFTACEKENLDQEEPQGHPVIVDNSVPSLADKVHVLPRIPIRPNETADEMLSYPTPFKLQLELGANDPTLED